MANESNPFGDVTKMIQQFKIPGLDMAPIIESRRKDMEALIDANKSANAALQTLAHKQTEIMTQAMHGIQESAKRFAAGGTGAPTAAKQADFLGDAYKKALADMKDLAEIVTKSQTDAMAGVTARATQSLEEMKKLTQPA